ncbi:ATP-binding cassette domain-containing protein [Pseudonocardiaceae bacterium YIM PH 21723]|nr:ATP-binding cassette domain-containing protein [Pseudonocardiaceae bacterium YIM PH 21723]
MTHEPSPEVDDVRGPSSPGHRQLRSHGAPALLMLGHGSRDAEGVGEYWELARMVRAAAPELAVGCGFVELATPSADEAIDTLVADGADDIVIVPLVLLAAGHLKNDGPGTVARARIRHPGVRFRLARDLGITPETLAVAQDRIQRAEGAAVALIGRGSSDPDACADLFKVARLLADRRGFDLVEAGFVSIARPGVPQVLDRCRALGASRIVVSPFFLFTGELVRRIHTQALDWAAEHPEVEVIIGDHLGADEHLVRLIIQRFREAVHGDVRMNCDLCTYRVQLPGYEDKVGLPISLETHEAPRRFRWPRKAKPPLTRQVQRGRFVSTGDISAPAVEVRGLSFSYPDGTEALSTVDLKIRPGERVALLGPNGAGKTSLVLQLNGVLTPSAGEVIIGGTPVRRDTLAEIRRKVGVVFQDPDDQLFMPTIGRDVAFGPANLGLRDAELADRVAEALSYVDMEEFADRAPNRLSLGQRRRAAVATVLAMRPEVLVLDEPSANLDPSARREFAELVKRLGMTTLLVTHDLPYALELCPRTVVIDHGQIVGDGPTRELLSDTGFMSAHRLELPVGFHALGVRS